MLLRRWGFRLRLDCFITENKERYLRFWQSFQSNHRYIYNNKLSSLHPGIFRTLKSLESLWVVVLFCCFFVFFSNSRNYGCEYMKVLYLNCGWRREYDSDLHSKEHYLTSSEKKAWKKFRPVRDLNPWPLRYQCSALPTELTSQLGAEFCVGSK